MDRLGVHAFWHLRGGVYLGHFARPLPGEGVAGFAGAYQPALRAAETPPRHDGSPTHAAAEPSCHRNTVSYRLRQLEELTGRSLTDPRDKLLLTLAMLARRSGG